MDTTTIHDLDPDVLNKILLLLEGPDLAAAAASSPLLRAAASDTWHHLCLSTWPSLRHGRLLPLLSSNPLSFFSEAFPFPLPSLSPPASPLPTELISAVDLYCHGQAVFSTVVVSETQSLWFQSTPFRIDALEWKDPERSPVIAAGGELTLSWIVINPISGKAVNVSSRRPVAVERHWCNEGTRVKFSVVLEERVAVAAVVTCIGEDMHVREVSLVVEDGEEGVCMNGRDAVATLRSAMEGRRTWKKAAEVKERYEEYEKRKVEKARKAERAELWCALAGTAAFAGGLLAMVAFR